MIRSRLGQWLRRFATSIDGNACISFSRYRDRPTRVYVRIEDVQYIDKHLDWVSVGLSGVTILYSRAVELQEAKAKP